MKFTKMHGCGNDYIFINCIENKIEDPSKVSQKVSDRHKGVGADGLILIHDSKVADFRMAMYNADGSEGKMCGNGIRCFAKYLYDNRLTKKKNITVETLSGIKEIDLEISNKKVEYITVRMGSPITKPDLIPVITDKDIIINEPFKVLEKEYFGTCISMGNPHLVIFVDDVVDIDIEKIGPEFENLEMFPDRVNTEFIKIIDRNTVEMRVWERGSGETQACGTGACASVVAGVLNGLTDDEVRVRLLGGELLVKYNQEENIVYMTGDAEEVYVGDYQI